MFDKYPTRLHHEWLHLVAVFVFVLAVYIWSAPRTVVLEDDGFFILAAYFNGIAHPPGYPLFTFLAHLITQLPLGSVAFRVHMLSALFGALACACLWWLVRSLIPGRIFAYTASLAFGFSQVYWSQAIIAEVYTLNVLLFLLLLILAFRYANQTNEGKGALLVAMGLFYGLALSNHWPLIVLSTPMLVLVVWPKWRHLIRRVHIVLICVLLGLLPYAWMIIRSQMNPEISFYGAIESWSDFWFVVSRQGYAGLDDSPSAGWWDKWQFCGFVLKESAKQLGPVGMVLSLVGLLGQWRVWPKSISLALVLGYVCNTFLLIGLLGFDYQLLHRNIFRVYPLIAYCVMSIWMALGMYLSLDWIIRKWGLNARSSVVATGISVVVIVMLLLLNTGMNYRGKDDWAQVYAHAVLKTLERDAVLFTDGDLDLNPLGYFNRIEEIRPDISLYSNKGIAFNNRLFTPRRDSHYERNRKIDNFIQSSRRPVYYTYGLPHLYGVEDYGLYKRIDLAIGTDRQRANASPEIVGYYKKLLALGEPVDPWEIMHYRLLMTDYCRLSLRLLQHSDKTEISSVELQEWVNQVCDLYHGYLEYIQILLDADSIDMDFVDALFKKAEDKREQAVLKSEHAQFSYLRAEMYLKMDKKEDAIQSLQKSIKVWAHPDNPSYKKLQKLTVIDS